MSFNEGGQKNTDFASKPRSPRFTLFYINLGRVFHKFLPQDPDPWTQKMRILADPDSDPQH